MEHDDGTVETTREEAHALLDAFADAGGNFVDTANGYGAGDSERWIGEWLEDEDREDYVIASKCYWSQLEENLGAIEVSLSDGEFERIDEARRED